MQPPYASLSLDLDNLWCYMKTHGDEGWDSYPSYLELVVPRILDFLDKRNVEITVFVVGRDAAIESNRQVLASIARAGHEIGNHSFHHEPWLHLYSEQQLVEDFESSESAILDATGQRPVGFRGPGFSFSDQVLGQLASRGYLYDASTFPTFLGPLARAYYFLISKFSSSQKEQRKQLFGKLSEGLRPIKPYLWELAIGSEKGSGVFCAKHPEGRSGKRLPTAFLLEMPVTTMPLFKIPIHVSYLSFLATFSSLLAKAYFQMAVQMCRLTKVNLSLLLHPLDFMDAGDAPQLEFFPGMKLKTEKKLANLNYYIDVIERTYQLVPMHQLANACLKQDLTRRALVQTSVAAD